MCRSKRFWVFLYIHFYVPAADSTFNFSCGLWWSLILDYLLTNLFYVCLSCVPVKMLIYFYLKFEYTTVVIFILYRIDHCVIDSVSVNSDQWLQQVSQAAHDAFLTLLVWQYQRCDLVSLNMFQICRFRSINRDFKEIRYI